MKKWMHTPEMRERLRKLRPVYNSVFRRQRDLSKLPSPAQSLAAMNGRGVMLFAFGRCGTTVFSDYLASHPKLVTFGEILNEDSYHSFFQWFSQRALRWWSFRPSLMEVEFYRYMVSLLNKNTGVHGLFDLKLEGLHLVEGNWRIPSPEYRMFTALEGSGAPVILMERRDLVARFVSGQVARRRGQYHSYHDGREIEPFELDIAAMETQIARVRAQLAHVRARFADYPAFEIVQYENLFEPDPDAPGQTRFSADLAPRMGALLGLDPAGFDVRPRLQKVSGKSDYPALITNWDAVQEARARLIG